MDLGPHAGFIAAAYAVAVCVVAILIVWVLADYRAQRRRLGELESHRLARGSEVYRQPKP